MFTKELEESINSMCIKAFESERDVVERIFEEWELDFISKETVIEYIKYRINKWLEMIWMNKLFEVKEELLSSIDWFEIELLTTTHTDFFQKKTRNYSRKTVSYNEEDLF